MGESTDADRVPQVRVVCTDRGQHPVKEIQVLFDYRASEPGGRIIPSARTSSRTRSGRQVVRNWPDPAGAYLLERSIPLRCTKCGRDPQRREETLGAELDQFYAVFPRGYPLDISYMD